jgi:hypothetical protein
MGAIFVAKDCIKSSRPKPANSTLAAQSKHLASTRQPTRLRTRTEGAHRTSALEGWRRARHETVPVAPTHRAG